MHSPRSVAAAVDKSNNNGRLTATWSELSSHSTDPTDTLKLPQPYRGPTTYIFTKETIDDDDDGDVDTNVLYNIQLSYSRHT